MKEYYVYILSSTSRTLYVGVTNDLGRRVSEHRQGRGSTFTSKYGIGRLVYFESTADVRAAIEREKQIKGWRRSKKVMLIEATNPTWSDLSVQESEPGPHRPMTDDADIGTSSGPLAKGPGAADSSRARSE